MSKQVNRPLTKNERKKEKRDEQRRQEEARLLATKRRRTLSIGLLAGVVVALAVILSVYFFVIAPNNSANGQTGSGTNTTASAPSGSLAPVIDNIGCYVNEGQVLHFHVHVSIYINGKAVAIPAQVGIPQTADPNNACLYWMHTHDTSGVLHMESPIQRDFTLGNFLHIWSQQFAQLQYPLQLDTSSGWTVYVNGQPHPGDFYNMKLTPHMLITLAYQSPSAQPDTTYNWGSL